MQICEHHSKNVGLAFVKSDVNLSLISILSSKKVAVVFAEKWDQSAATGEFMLVVEEDAPVGLPVLLLHGHVLAELEVLELDEGEFWGLLEGEVRPLHEGVD